MNRMNLNCLLVACCVAAIFALAATPVEAQYRPLPSSSSSSIGGGEVKGERYHIELSGNLWNPPPDFRFSSEGLGILGTDIDLDADLGIEQKQMYEVRLVLRPAKKHKLRAHYLPMTYTGDTTLKRDIVFNGIRYTASLPVKTDFTWAAYRFTYEYDVFYRERGFVGILLEAKYADTSLTLDSPVSVEYVKARAPIPAAGLVGRVYPLSFVSLSGEFTYFRLPDSVDENASFNSLDFDIYATVNIGHHLGIQGGYRSIDMAFGLDSDSGSIKLKGPYVGGVLRF